jgi:peptidyl-prolyl cis-trans isomerase B (cyclophilin B)
MAQDWPARERRRPAICLSPRLFQRKEFIMVELHTNYGVIKLDLDAEKAPKTVENFLNYVKKGHYDNTVFHRVIDGFMIQGGGFEPGMKQKPTDAPIDNEANNGLKNVTGSIAMARTNDPHSATAQFFINVNDNDFLNHSSPTPQGWGYAVFGRVVEGLDVVEKIKKVKTGSKGFHQDVPVDDVVIEKAVVVD